MLDFIITISTFNRNDILSKIIDKINSENSKHNYKIIIYNDGNDIDSFSKTFESKDNVSIINGAQNHGKIFYWKSINYLLEEIKKYDYKYCIQLDDDHYPTSSFFDKINKIYASIDQSCITKAVINDNYLDQRWGYKHWVDGGSIYPKVIFETIGYYIRPIPINRWSKNNLLSSGVWRQITKRINKYNFKVLTPNISLAKHICEKDSIMNTELRKKQPLKTINFYE
jgi:hypothetical protein